MKHIYKIILLFALVACNQSTSPTPSFDTFIKRFRLQELPITTQLDRVYNSSLVTTRMDTLSVQSFIDSSYQLLPMNAAFYGYAYGIRIPKDTFTYTAVVYFKANSTQNTFVLKTYNNEGKAIANLPIAQHNTKTNQKTICRISKNRKIELATFIPYITKQDTTKMTYSLQPNGQIIAEDKKSD